MLNLICKKELFYEIHIGSRDRSNDYLGSFILGNGTPCRLPYPAPDLSHPLVGETVLLQTHHLLRNHPNTNVATG